MSSNRKEKREIEKQLKKINKKNAVKIHNTKRKIKLFFDSEEGEEYFKDICKTFID